MADANTPTTESGALDVLTAKTGTTAKPGIVNQSILEDMQKLYDQKLAEKNYFLQDLADASAWWSGGAAGPSAGLAQRAQTRALQSKQLEDLQAQLSQGKVNLAQLGQANEELKPGAAALSGIPTGGTGSAGTQFSAAGEKLVPYKGVMIPERVYRVLQTYISAGNKAKADEEFAKYVTEENKFFTNPNAYEQKDYFDKNTGADRRSAIDIRGGANAPVVRPSTVAPAVQPSVNAPSVQPSTVIPSAQPSSVVPTSVRSTDQGDVYRFENLSDGAKERLNNYAKTELGLQGDAMKRADASELFNRMPMEQRRNAFLKSGETPVVSTQAQAQVPAMTPVSTTAPTQGPQNYSQYKTEQAGREKSAEQEGTAVGKAAGERRASLENIRSELGLKIKNANSLLNILDETPEAVGIGFRNPTTGAILEAGRAGLFLGKRDLEELAATQLSPKARANRAKFDSIAAAVVAEERRNLAKGTGTVSNYETEQFEKATGLNKKSPAEANRYFAIFIAENLRAKAELIKELDKNPKQAMGDFERSARYKEILDERDNRLSKIFPELANKDIAFGEKIPKISKDRMNELDKIYGGAR
jgi:hypothetical protein